LGQGVTAEEFSILSTIKCIYSVECTGAGTEGFNLGSLFLSGLVTQQGSSFKREGTGFGVKLSLCDGFYL